MFRAIAASRHRSAVLRTEPRRVSALRAAATIAGDLFAVSMIPLVVWLALVATP